MINAESVNAGRIGGDIYNTSNIHITNYSYREDIRVAAVQLVSNAFSDEKLPCPYRGLYHFSPGDAEYFFGREVFIKELFKATQTRNFIPVLGASGSGKSSVVLAGLVPKLQQQGRWLFTHFRPGSNPFYGLAEALVPLYTPEKDDTDRIAQTRKLSNYFSNDDVLLVDVIAKIKQNHPHHRVLLIADQFEELFTLCNDEKIRHKFLDCLLTFIQSPISKSLSAVFVATMRVDFLSYTLLYPEFADQLKSDIKIRSMNRSELTDVIAKPAQKLGVTFQDGLIERILDDVKSEPGNLPVLEFALTLLWEKHQSKQLTHTAYEDIGKVEGALASYADQKYDNLTTTEQEKVRQIFIQLVQPGEGIEDTRRLATKAELGEANWELVTKLADARLIVTSDNASGEQTVEVVHEVLIQNWEKLRQWMKTDREFRAWQQQLRVSKYQWQKNYKDEGALLRGKALLEAENWWEINQDKLYAEQEYIQASVAQREYEEKEKEKRIQQELKQQKIKTRWATSTAIFAIMALGAGGFAWLQQHQAEQSLQSFMLGVEPPTLELLNKLPSYLKQADKLSQHKGNEKDIALSIGYYHAILESTTNLEKRIAENSQEFLNLEQVRQEIKSISIKTLNSLTGVILKERFFLIEKDMKKGKFGRLKTLEELTQKQHSKLNSGDKYFENNQNQISDYLNLENNYTDGAIKKTYEILMTKFGFGADVNSNGLLDQAEASRIPCIILKKIEELWRNQTKNRCGWYGNISEISAPACDELDSKSLIYTIFTPPYDIPLQRLEECKIHLNKD
ncbi:nSTAND1 domain-containing NTPase [Nostoc sp. 'Peltigera membranacea cyanobiont' 213]|uniref:nSTAND1 domain-containing NTPase n=1 Tax=Nostoc sp. 'Peltigera membranacea cyanobiont' 213 TaxID=2014530 RepID=UPI00117D783F|nr:hypothetical protein [Nostoc sp. 'Peltigera membranacea cyanobiont' 213]